VVVVGVGVVVGGWRGNDTAEINYVKIVCVLWSALDWYVLKYVHTYIYLYDKHGLFSEYHFCKSACLKKSEIRLKY